MASHDISWVPGAHVCFGNLDFIIMVGGELALAHATVQPLPSIALDIVGEVVEELQLHAPGACALETTSSSTIGGLSASSASS